MIFIRLLNVISVESANERLVVLWSSSGLEKVELNVPHLWNQQIVHIRTHPRSVFRYLI